MPWPSSRTARPSSPAAFTSFDSNPYNRIVRVLPNGYQDPTFLAAPNSGANDFIAALALQPDGKIIIGGNFTSFNGYNRYHIARLNSDGTVDTTFNPGLGANGTVWSVALDAAGRVIIARRLLFVNNVNLNRVARLNADGSVDTSLTPASARMRRSNDRGVGCAWPRSHRWRL